MSSLVLPLRTPEIVTVNIVFEDKKIRVTPEKAEVHVGQVVRWQFFLREYLVRPVTLTIYFQEEATPFDWVNISARIHANSQSWTSSREWNHPVSIKGVPKPDAQGRDYKYGVHIAGGSETIDDEDPYIIVL